MKNFLALLLLLSGTCFAQNEKTIFDYWNETRIDQTLVKSVINDQNCLKDKQRYVACMETLQYLYDYIEGQNLSDIELKYNKKNQKISFSIKPALKNNIEGAKNRKNSYLNQFFEIKKHNKSAINLKLSQLLESLRKQDQNKFKGYLAFLYNRYIRIAVDPHSRIVPINLDDQNRNNSASSHVGFGISAHFVQDGVLVTRVFENSAASKAGIKAGDILREINDICLEGEEDPFYYISGKKGDKKNCLIKRDNEEFYSELLLTPFESKYVESDIFVSSTSQKIGYIKLATFYSQKVCEEFGNSLYSIINQIDSLIIDIRNNGGGYLNQAVCISDLLLEPGKKVLSIKDSSQEIIYATRMKKVYKGKIVVLVNGRSASASELMASALFDNDRALVVGSPTFGKGNYQSPDNKSVKGYVSQKETPLGKWIERQKRRWDNMFDSKEYGDIRLWKTKGLYYSPKGKSVQLVGVPLHIEIDEVSPTGKVIEHTAEKDQYLYPLESGQPQLLSNSQKQKKEEARKCLLSIKEDILKTQEDNSSDSMLIDLQLATAMHALDCY